LCTGDFLQSFRYIWCSSWICYKESDEKAAVVFGLFVTALYTIKKAMRALDEIRETK